MYTYNGLTLSLHKWSERVDVSYAVLSKRINLYGWSFDRAVRKMTPSEVQRAIRCERAVAVGHTTEFLEKKRLARETAEKKRLGRIADLEETERRDIELLDEFNEAGWGRFMKAHGGRAEGRKIYSRLKRKFGSALVRHSRGLSHVV